MLVGAAKPEQKSKNKKNQHRERERERERETQREREREREHTKRAKAKGGWQVEAKRNSRLVTVPARTLGAVSQPRAAVRSVVGRHTRRWWGDAVR